MKLSLESGKKENLIVFLTFITYFAVTISKYCYSASLPSIIDYFQISKSEAGLITTIMFIVYGTGQVLHGLFCKFYNVKYSVFIGMALSGLATLLMPFLPFSIYPYLMAINGIGCSFLWTSLVRLMAENLSEKKLSAAILANAFSVSLGVAFSYGLSALSSFLSHFQISFYVGGSFALLIAFLWLFLINISNANVSRCLQKNEEKNRDGKKKIAFPILFMLTIFALTAIANNMIREGVVSWTPKILIDTYSLNESLSTILTIINSILSLLGTFFALVLRKKIKNDMVLSFIFFFIATLSSVLLTFFYNNSIAIFILSAAIISLSMGAVNNIVTAIVPVYFRNEMSSGLIAGLMDGFCYIGSAISGYGLGLIAENKGWQGVFILFLVSGIVVSVLLIAGIILKKKKESQN